MKLSRRFPVEIALLATVLLGLGSLPARAQSGVGLPVGRAAASDQIVRPPTDPPTQVSIAVKAPYAYAAAGIPGSFQLRRTGSVLGDVTINYQVSGPAVAGQDYKALKGTRTIPATKSTVLITINPYDVAGSGGAVKRVRVTLLPGDGYSVSAAAQAAVKIVQ